MLGLTVDERRKRSAELETGECVLKIEEEFDAATLDTFGLEPPGEKRGDGAIIILEVTDVQDVYEQAIADDSEVLTDPREDKWNRELFLIGDPDGYVLEVTLPLR